MAKKSGAINSQRSFLSLWEPPTKAGEPVGVLASTFTLDMALFEEECLARFAGVKSDPLRDGSLYRIEREEKLANLRCAAVIADIHNCAGRRSLRWDLLAARPRSGIMHAKVSLLAWAGHVRAIVGSANLTTEGYRRNQECVCTIDFNEEFSDETLLEPLLDYLRELLQITAGPARVRAEQFLDWVGKALPRHPAPSRGIQRKLILIGPNKPSLFAQLQGILPGSSPPDEAHVVSPFFDPALRELGPENALWKMMRQRGTVAVNLHVAGEEAVESNNWRLQVPRHVLEATPTGRSGVTINLWPVNVTTVPTDSGPEQRPLHTKSLTLQSETWIAHVIGSSNFTSAGCGLSPYARNFEANVAFVLRQAAGAKERVDLETRILRGGHSVELSEGVIFAPAIDIDETAESDAPPLPAFFSEATLARVSTEEYGFTLAFVGVSLKESWSIWSGTVSLLKSEEWRQLDEPAFASVTLQRQAAPPSSLRVEWNDGKYRAEWPINAISVGVLPPPPELQGLSLAALLDLLGSNRPLHEALRAWLKRQPDDDDADVETTLELVDPHAKVDTSKFLIKRVQRACWAIGQLRAKLESPFVSAAAIGWRINGPVGARAVLNAIRAQCGFDTPDEGPFLECELLREMKQVRLHVANGIPPEKEAVKMLRCFINEIEAELAKNLRGASLEMRKYVEASLLEAKRESARVA